MDSHGRFEFYTQGRLIWIKVEGGINYEFACQYRDEVIATVCTLPPGPWIRVTDIRQWELGGPEIVLPLHELMVWCEGHQMAHSINIVSLFNLQKHMLDAMMMGIVRHSERHLTKQIPETLHLVQQLFPDFDATAVIARFYQEENLSPQMWPPKV